ncbi:TetR/AcrR family transcriptional regulator [Celeribacter litoreus]|uniref:TetR/AcrR family transcriptional regulator n=1 Tax=Celeribacter litoreus TaxID=2876714 RepID=UPI001CCE6746|nr:TetR/AcrR family transcriptional regulator [Celeribacter litoreus]MCA0042489.1 TetR/AcrR family transcriptional regulator [Celeribacter litoreus]
MKEDRLSKEDWLETGLKIFGQSGPGGLRIATVCNAMKVSKGSFYWHFKDRQDFLISLFEFWRKRETTALIVFVENAYSEPRDRIWHVVELVTLGDYDSATELAMRQWGQSDENVSASLEKVDAERIAFFTRQFEASGFDTETAHLRAIAIYALTLSSDYMQTNETKAALEARLQTSLDMLLEMR